MYRKLLLASVLCLLAFANARDATAAKLGEFCGGFIGIKCDKGLWCQFQDGSCGRFDAGGSCAAVPRFCPHVVRYVCGCDKKTYTNDCVRQQHRVSKAHDGKC